MTLTGQLALIGVIALIATMAWLGWRGRWWVGVALTVPFVAYLAWLEVTIAGPPMWEDPYGPMLAMIVLGPITVGWFAFLMFRLGQYVRRRTHSAN